MEFILILIYIIFPAWLIDHISERKEIEKAKRDIRANIQSTANNHNQRMREMYGEEEAKKYYW